MTLRWRPRSGAQRTGSTPRARLSGAALRLDPSRRSRLRINRGRGSPRSAASAAHVAAAYQTKVVAEMRLETARPVALPRGLPLRRVLDRRRGEMIERDVLPVAGAPEAACAQHARHGRERGDVLLVVPLVELG